MNQSDAGNAQLVMVAIEGAIATITLSRPEKRNALSMVMVEQLMDAFSSLPKTVRAVILSGAGEHFCSGLDLSELKESSSAENIEGSMLWYEAFGKIQFGRIPVIAVMHGAVVGGGLELASALHVRIAESDAYFGLPEGQRGIFLGGGGSVRITKLIGFSRVAEMMLTGHVVDAKEAHQIGLAHYVVKKGDGMRKARELAEKVASNLPMSNFAILKALPLIAEQPMSHGLLTESLMAAITQDAPEAKDRVNAFLQKRAEKITLD